MWEPCLILRNTALCRDEIKFYCSDFSSDFWSITGQSTLFSLVESLRDVKLVKQSHRFCFPSEKRTTFRVEGNAESLCICLSLESHCCFSVYPTQCIPTHLLPLPLQLPCGRWAMGCHGIFGWRFFDRRGDGNLHGRRSDRSCVPWGKANSQSDLSRTYLELPYLCISGFCIWWDLSLGTVEVGEISCTLPSSFYDNLSWDFYHHSFFFKGNYILKESLYIYTYI